jgi:hypothetical protein
MGKHGAPGEPDEDTQVFCVAPDCKREILGSEQRVRISIRDLRGHMHTECLVRHNEAQRGRTVGS